jgi:hypothetical protein
MSWKDRVKETIQFISPEGNTFIALWRGNARSKEKKLGLFDYPKVRGTVVQDLDITSTRYPLTFFFEGENHDVEAERFFTACDERGPWKINHPVKGILSLYLLNVAELVDPIESGNITEFTTEWVESIDPTIVQSVRKLIPKVKNGIFDLNSLSVDQFNERLYLNLASELSAIEVAIGKIVTAYNQTIGAVFSKFSEINSAINAIQRGITDTFQAVIFKPLQLAGQIQELVQLPSLVLTDFQAKFAAYNEFSQQIFGLSPTGTDKEAINTALSLELTLSAAIGALAQIGITAIGDADDPIYIQTRPQAFEFADDLSQIFIDITDNLDLAQENVKDNPVDVQYFSQLLSFPAAFRTMLDAIDYISKQAFNLSIEKRFILEKPRAPIEITITEYGELGENDNNFDLFIQSNKLKKNDILVLPAGREVVIYA